MGERRRVGAIVGVGLLLMVRTLLALNDSGREQSSEDHNVAFLEAVSDLSDITIPKDSDSLLLVNNRTSDSVYTNSSDKNNSDNEDYVIIENGDSTEVPMSALNTDISPITDRPESIDEEEPTTSNILNVTSEEDDEVTTIVDVTTTEEDRLTVLMDGSEDITTVTDSVTDMGDTTNDSIVESSTEVTTFDVTTVTPADDCVVFENDCKLNTAESLEANNSSVLETSQILHKDSENLETPTFLNYAETDSQMLVSHPTSEFADHIIVPDVDEVVVENRLSSTESEVVTDPVTSASEFVTDSEISEGRVTDTEEFDTKNNSVEDDLIVETLISTATVYYDEESLQNLETSRRYPRTVSPDLYATPLGAHNGVASNQYRGFLSQDPATMKTPVNSRSAFERRKAQRKSDPDIDDIIKGIVQLLGGNVKVTAAEEHNTRLTTFGNDHISSRINNRGPPRLPHIPFGVLSSAILTRPPIRLPVTPPANLPNLHPVPGLPPGRPAYVANTRPPFLAPLPPSLASRPSPPIQKPYLTAIPLPIDLLPNSEEANDGAPAHSIDPVIPDYDESTTIIGEYTPLLESSTGAATSSQATVLSSNTEEMLIETITTFTTMHSKDKETENETSIPETTHLSTQHFAAVPEVPTTVPLISTTVSESSIIKTSTESYLEPSILEPTSVLITPTPVTEEEPQQSTHAPVIEEKPQHMTTIATAVFSSSQVTPSTFEPANDHPLSSSATPPLQQTSPALSSEPSSVSQSTSVWPLTPSIARPRPGVVLDDSNYHPGHIITGTVLPFDTGRPGDIFDVTVSAYQDFGGGSRPLARPPSNLGKPYIIPVDPQSNNNNNNPLITTPVGGGDDVVIIDGRKTYFNLFPTATQSQGLAQDQTVGTGVGIVIPEEDIVPSGQGGHGGFYQVRPVQQRPSSRPLPTQPPPLPPTPPPKQSSTRPISPVRKTSYNRRPTQPPIRIDTCIVGDDSTCQEQLSEVCRTEEGVSSCYCKPGTARKRPRTPCKRMVSLRVSMKVDRVGDQRIVWGGNYGNPESEEYRLLEWEARHAIANAMSKTRLSSAYLGNIIHKFYNLGGKVIVNSTINLEDTPTTRNRNIPQMLQRQMIQVIQSHTNNIGDSALYVDGPLNPIPDVSDVNECNDPTLYDCHPDASCINEFGTFTCRCLPGYTDRYSDDPEQVGRKCETCSSDYCNKRGDCRIASGQKVCECMGSYYGTRCEIDGEVLGVAVGASVAAVVIIILTLIFLCMWSRRWKAQDRKTEVLARGAAAGATLGGFAVNMQHKSASLQPNQYGVSMEDRMRWAQIAETMTSQNIYAPHLQDPCGGSAVYTANSSEYLTATATSNPFSVYNRVTRALSNSTIGKGRGGHGGILDRLRGLLGRPSKANTKNRIPSYMMTSHPTLNFQQLMALHAQLASQPEQLRGTLAGPSSPPTIAATTPTPLFKNQRQMAASSSGYASLGTLGSNATGEYSHQPHRQQFGLQHLNPLNHLTTMQHQQQQQYQKQQQQQAFGAQSTYSQYGPASFSAMSQSGIGGGVSRAPTLGARTPVPLHEGMGGAATIGPMGGASVAATGMGTTMGMMESSEEEMDRPYQLPRPKSRGSLADGSDIYYEPEDLTATYGPPDRPPPPIPKTSHPQTYNFSFLH